MIKFVLLPCVCASRGVELSPQDGHVHGQGPLTQVTELLSVFRYIFQCLYYLESVNGFCAPPEGI